MNTRKTIQVYIPIKEDSHIKGYWKDEQGKVYIDNIIISRYTVNQFERVKAYLFNAGELAIFYKIGNAAIIEDIEGKRIYLNNKILLRYEHLRPSIFKALLKDYKGFTVYKNKGYYLIEIWQE
jgi:hypothetical protein